MTPLARLCHDFRRTGSGYIYFEAIEELLAVYPDEVDYLIGLYEQEELAWFKEALAMLIIDARPFVPAIEYLRDVCRWPAEDFEDYAGYRQWVRQRGAPP